MNYVKNNNHGLIIRLMGSGRDLWSMLSHFDLSEFFEYFVDIPKRIFFENYYVTKNIFRYLVF